MVQERYCSFEVSKLLKEKNFNDEVRTYYWFDNETKEVELIHDDRLDTPNLWSGDYVSAPTHQMASCESKKETASSVSHVDVLHDGHRYVVFHSKIGYGEAMCVLHSPDCVCNGKND